MMKNIAILAGGYSTERQISINSANQIYKELLERKSFNLYLVYVNKDGFFVEHKGKMIDLNLNTFSATIDNKTIKFDYAVNAIHGTPGEDGKIQGLLDVLNIPHSSSSVFTSALSFDKIATKKFFSSSNIMMAEMIVLEKGEENDSYADISKKIGYPCFVKPNTSGSSYGISKVYQEKDLKKAVDLAYTEDSTVIVEKFIDGVEVSCGVLKTGNETFVFPITEIDTKNDFFDTEAKYEPGVTNEITPARVPEEHSKKVQELALKVYNELKCKGLTRVDFIIKDGEPYFLELNTIPGMSAASIVPKQLDTVEISIGEIFEKIIKNDLKI